MMDLTTEIRTAEAHLNRLRAELEEQNSPLNPGVVRGILGVQNEEILGIQKTLHIVVGILHEKFPDLARAVKLPIAVQDLPY